MDHRDRRSLCVHAVERRIPGRKKMTEELQSSSKRWTDCSCGFLALRLQNRGGTYSTPSLRSCSLRIPRSGSATRVHSRNQSTFLRRTVCTSKSSLGCGNYFRDNLKI
ncbi:hypothetical protein Y032_0205g1936 [Ancylostoma ceylanicum]|uniref:Uncharacterized protein n=1 Tax=Ancylostoma ceylanicum TaxID=53326 RepID=A0A016SMF1_9BILA|nr:hypothetical protein Y032_0205g1936 [Ancylostoma ceylanicum]